MLKMMLYNFVLLLTEQDRVKRQTKGFPTLFKTHRLKMNNVAPPTTNNILQRVMTEPSFVDIGFFSRRLILSVLHLWHQHLKRIIITNWLKFITVHIAILAHRSFLLYGVTLWWLQFSV